MPTLSGSLSRLELQLVAKFPSDASEEFARHGSNDFAIQSTDANRAILGRVLEDRPEKNGLSTAELDLAAQLLRLVLDGVGPDDEYMLPDGDDGEALLQEVVAHAGRDDASGGLPDLASESAELTLPVSVLLCQRMAAFSPEADGFSR